MVSKELLDILACPSCKGDLQYDAEKEILTCRAPHCPECGMPVNDKGVCSNTDCGKVSEKFVGMIYRVEDDIPIMLIDEAQKFEL